MADYGEELGGVGDRVEIHPCCDMWMRGARYGVITSRRGGFTFIKLDKMPHARFKSKQDLYRLLAKGETR